jgi:hypothetical protein
VTTPHDNASHCASTASATRQNATPHAPQKQARQAERRATARGVRGYQASVKIGADFVSVGPDAQLEEFGVLVLHGG